MVGQVSRLEGAAQLDAQLRALGSAYAVPILRAAVKAGMQPAYERAAATMPVGTEAHRTYKGRLVAPGFAKRSLRIVTKAAAGGQSVSAALGVRKEAFYEVLFQELGSNHNKAHPWLRASLRDTQQECYARLQDKLRQRLLAVIKK